MTDRGLAAYIAELVGTMLLTFFITSVVVLYVATGASAQFGSAFAEAHLWGDSQGQTHCQTRWFCGILPTCLT